MEQHILMRDGSDADVFNLYPYQAENVVMKRLHTSAWIFEISYMHYFQIDKVVDVVLYPCD